MRFRTKKLKARDKEIKERYQNGESITSLAKAYDRSRHRIYQIVKGIKRMGKEEWTAYHRKYRAKNREKIRKYKREYNRRWRKENGYHNEKASVYRYKDKQKARWMVAEAILKGKIVRKPCLCGSKKSHAHHDDYSKPLEVRWLCPQHHMAIHKRDLSKKEIGWAKVISKHKEDVREKIRQRKERNKRIMASIRKGVRTREIARIEGVSVQTIYNVKCGL